MYNLLKKLFGIIFPPSAEARLVETCTESDLQRALQVHMAHSHIIALSRFNTTHVAALIHEAKFRGNTRAQKLLGVLLVTYLKKHMSRETCTVIPIPLSRKRFRERGYNQVEEIIRAAALVYPLIHMEKNLLTRVRDTLPQTSLNREKRIHNMHQAFAVPYPEKIAGKHLIVVDDVTTTGATLSVASSVLIPHSPASITLIALAH